MTDRGTPIKHRDKGEENAIVFVHGFGGHPEATWGEFPRYLSDSQTLMGWAIYSVGYLSRLAPDFRGIWSGNPSITEIATSLGTHTTHGPLKKFKAFCFIAHSMGGLVVQRALLSRPDLMARTSHVFLFGTPSDGLTKASWIHWFKRQTGDMAADKSFINQLRDDRERDWPNQPPPHLWAIAGDADEFVPASTSLGPFAESQRIVVPGNHLEIVKPVNADSLSVKIVESGIRRDAASAGPWNSARVALQLLEFNKAVQTLSAHSDELDDTHLIELALALEGLGRSEEAFEVLKKAGKRGTDAQGVLAGRLKRRWKAEGRAADYDGALRLYSEAFDESVREENHAQAFYHGINVCFLRSARARGELKAVKAMAEQVLGHCDAAGQDFWCLGTRAEANLYLDRTEEALEAYRQAVAFEPAPGARQLQSMYEQASQYAEFIQSDSLRRRLEEIFLRS